MFGNLGDLVDSEGSENEEGSEKENLTGNDHIIDKKKKRRHLFQSDDEHDLVNDIDDEIDNDKNDPMSETDNETSSN